MDVEDARSDLLLAGAAFVFGDLILRILLELIPLTDVPVLGEALIILLPLVTTVLVPALLIRYRNEPLSLYGLASSSVGTLGVGALVALPLVVAAAVAALVGGNGVLSGLPLVSVVTGGVGPVEFASRLTGWLGLAGLAVYGTVKAREAFFAEPRGLRGEAVTIGRVVAAVAGVAVLLLVFAVGGSQVARLVLLPLGVAAAVELARRGVRGPTTTTRPTLIVPVVLLALGPFVLSFSAVGFVLSVWSAALAGGLGLAIGLLQESRRSAFPALALALVAALLTNLVSFAGV
jgi:hypothetical protein